MKTSFITTMAVLLASSSLLGACATGGLNMPPENQVSNGEYNVYVFPGNLPHVAEKDQVFNQPATFGVDEFEQMTYLDRNCRTQMADQNPSALKSIGTTVLRTAVPIAIGGAIGTGVGIKSVSSAAKGYYTYGAWAAGGSGAGAGFGGGIDRHLTGNRYSQAGCMNAAVTEAKKRIGVLSGIDIIFNADAVNGRSVKRPAGTASVNPPSHKPDPNAEQNARPPGN